MLHSGEDPLKPLAFEDYWQSRLAISASTLYIPISLGNHYYTNKVLQYILDELVSVSRHSTIVICDELRRISYLQRFPGKPEVLINQIIAKQIQEFRQRLINCGCHQYSNLNIDTWNHTPRLSSLKALEKSVLREIKNSSSSVQAAIAELPSHILKGSTTGCVPSSLVELQLSYLSTETAMSIHYNEVLDYDFEVYRRGGGFIDNFYIHNENFIRQIICRPPSRRLIELEIYKDNCPQACSA